MPSNRTRTPATCEACGATFMAEKPAGGRPPRRYCGRACFARAKAARVIRTCGRCDTVFTTTASQVAKGGGIYCGRTCQGLANRRRVTLICRYCSLPFERTEATAAEAAYCSRSCRSTMRGELARECRECGAVFLADQTRIRKGQALFCSDACARIARRGVSPCKTSPQDRFWSRVDKNGPVVQLAIGPCWLWLGPRDRKGYGTTHLGGSRQRGAHQAAWLFANGPIPQGLWVLHKCDNPPCVRPDHLFLGTSDDNIMDMIRKDRHAYGSRKPKAKLTEIDIVEIRRLCSNGTPYRPIAARFGVSLSLIGLICRRKRWRHVP